ncbi:MAG TPA: tetraacyldisaccharide 4'-kinase, partial [Candidatus Cloacimonadota bacterium]|nr:tetraacyldisaccharide 4'-kinase [Candidatus Cloacimonadota bacterium]
MLLRRKYCYPHPYRSRHKIISIGNLSAGGSGKTPITIALAQAMSQSGLKVAVSHRGYKGEAEHGLALVSDRDKILLNARQAGDEAVLIASSLPGIPVVAGKNRARALRLLESRFPDLDCIIMDDTFQHLAVARDLDFVVCDTAIGFANGRCLPAGYLREPVSVLNEDIVVLLHQKPGSPPATREQRRIVLRYTPLFYNVYSTSDHLTDCSGNAVSPSVLEGKRIALVSG